MGTGFWIMQLALLVAAIATAVYSERRNRCSPDESSFVGRTTPDARPSFTPLERRRLLVLRRLVEQSQLLRVNLYDDLTPEVRIEPEPRIEWPWRQAMLWSALFLVLVGCVGVWQTNAAMAQLDRGPLFGHLVPGVIANPGKYLATVNSATSTVPLAARDPFQALALLDRKQAMDRYEALLGLGLAWLVGAAARSSASSPNAPHSIAGDVVPFIIVAAALCGALSFFELP